MAGTLQKVKHLASQCAVVAGNPTRSPTTSTSPVIHLRRRGRRRHRKTLRMLLALTSPPSSDTRSCDRRVLRHPSSDPRQKNEEKHNKLKDLFVSSPSPPPPPPLRIHLQDRVGHGAGARMLPLTSSRAGGARRLAAGSLRPLSAAFRTRMVRGAWRPMLGGIPE